MTTPKKHGRPALPCASCGSAQPKHRGRCVACGAKVQRALAKPDTNNGWIPAWRKGPKTEDPVMALTDSGIQLSAWMDNAGNWISSETGYELTVTHWRKLHKLPQ